MPPLLKWLHTFRRRNVTSIILITAALELAGQRLLPFGGELEPKTAFSLPAQLFPLPMLLAVSSFLLAQLSLGLVCVAPEPLLCPL